jgi:hypothetical protein
VNAWKRTLPTAADAEKAPQVIGSLLDSAFAVKTHLIFAALVLLRKTLFELQKRHKQLERYAKRTPKLG